MFDFHHAADRAARRAAFIRATARLTSLSLTASAALLPLSAQAGRPWNTDDAGVIDAGACQLEAWTEQVRHDGHTAPAYWLNPGCTPVERTELSFGVGWDDDDDTHLTAWQVKHQLRDLSDQAPGFALSLGSDRDRRIHDDLLGDMTFNGITSVPLQGEALVAHVNLGVTHHRDEDHGWETRANWGSALEWQWLPQTHLGAEMFGLGGQRPSWQLGARHELLAERLQLDVSFGAPVGRWHEERTLTLGVVLVSPAFLH